MHVDVGDARARCAARSVPSARRGRRHQLEHRVLGAADGDACRTAVRTGAPRSAPCTTIAPVPESHGLAMLVTSRPRRRGARRARARRPRSDVVIERADGDGVFTADRGPFSALRAHARAARRRQVLETTQFRLAIPFWWFLFVAAPTAPHCAGRRHAEIGPRGGRPLIRRTPAPPPSSDLLCILASDRRLRRHACSPRR